MTTMATEFPLIARNADIISNHLKQIYSQVCKVPIEEEQAYLDEIENFINKEFMNTIRRIQYKRQSIINTKNFDISKVQNLPPDMVYEISTYLQPEIEYTRKFMLLRDLKIALFNYPWEMAWSIEHILLKKVSKKLMMKLIDDCGIYPSINNIRVPKKHSKGVWCIMILQSLLRLTHTSILEDGIDKTLIIDPNMQYNTTCWYNFILHITVYNKYRNELEHDMCVQLHLIQNLKNNSIKVKK